MIMEKYFHGGYLVNGTCGYVDFSANIAPFGIPGKIKDAVISSIERADRYPDPFCVRLREELAKKYGVAFENVIAGNGACDLIYRIAGALRGSIGEALIIEPAFSEYAKALCVNGIPVRHFLPASPLFEAASDDIIKWLEDRDFRKGVVFIANPSNPTGALIRRDELLRLSEACRRRDTVLVIDECFMGFIEDASLYSALEPARGFAAEYENVLVLNAFTKLYAMPGLRLGYLTGGKELLKRIEEQRQPWQIALPSYEAGLMALKLEDGEYRLPLIHYIEGERSFLRSALQKQGFEVWDGRANYLFFKGRRGLKEDLLQKGLLIRDCSDYYGLAGSAEECFYRIAVLKRKDNETLIKGLETVKDGLWQDA